MDNFDSQVNADNDLGSRRKLWLHCKDFIEGICDIVGYKETED